MKLVITQFKMELLRIFRNPYYVFWSLAMPIVFYFLFTRIISTGAPDAAAWNNHYLMSMAAFSIMGSAIMTLGIRIVQERNHGWSTFMRVTPLPGAIYFLGKMFGQTIMHLTSIIFIFVAGYLINGVSLPALTWIYCGLWLLIASSPFLALGTLVGCMKRVDTASGVSNALYLVMALLGGMWMPLEILPNIMQNIGKWMPSYNFGNGAWELVQGNPPEWSNILILAGYFILFMLISIYTRRKQEAI
ncbi:ABC transporter permease [Paenibacillus lutimineralis]|uniref:ABC transporter permease n=1 Tax=Paenibacillus lutimineralis TaxID=2707005 RepID=A0A3Q9I5K4_9BACL|nr:ABC transporter permease [Paenibacillus lutimineralis]AZS13178.1 ABC transporter permease [Paenibacillus lutimineralis]